tara:strand:+ start:2562 stop:4058 length:1497 start_codon:yes stop_codon:yes gene_type:complete
MGMTLEQGPSTILVHGAFEPITFVLTSTEQAGGTFFKFKYIADIYVENTSSPYAYALQARIKIEPNGAGAGVFRVDKIIADYVAITTGDSSTSAAGFVNDTIHTLGSNSTTKIWVNNDGTNYRKIKVNFGQEYATTATTAPTEYLDVIPDNYVSCVMSAGMQMLPTWDEGGIYTSAGSNYLSDFCPNDSTKKALSDRPTTTEYTSILASNVSVINQDVTNFEWRTLAVLMDDTSPVASDAVSFYVALYNSSDSQLDAAFFTAGTDGGTTPANSDQDYERLQYVGIGPRNLTAQTIDTGFTTHFDAGTVAYYEVFFMDDSVTLPANGTTANMASLCYRFTVKSASCIYRNLNGSNKYNYVTLAWQNSLGSWDYQAFALKHQRTTSNIERKTFDQVAGNWETANTGVQFAYRGDEGGVTTTQIQARQTMVANSDLYNEDEVAFLENLWLSPKVQLLNYDGSAIPITLTDKNWIRKNNLNEGGAFTYQVSFEYGKQRPTVR